jgi:hypothetical protein
MPVVAMSVSVLSSSTSTCRSHRFCSLRSSSPFGGAVGFDKPCHPPYEQGLAAVMAGATGGGNHRGWGSSVVLHANICTCRLECQ